MNKKAVSQVSIIGGADGPTSVFILGQNKSRLLFRQKLHKMLYDIRKRYIMRGIKANPHSLDEVTDYIKSKGYKELDEDTMEYKIEYRQMRASFLLQYKPQLLGGLAEFPKLEEHSTEAVNEFMEQMEQRRKAAEEVPRELFDIEMHILDKHDDNTSSRIVIEKKYGYIGGSASGEKNLKEYHKLFREVYKYYGVSQEDIDQKTKRYEELVRTLAIK